MKNIIISIIGIAMGIAFINKVQAQQQYEQNWESIAKAPIPKWFKDAKFGIFIHWGVYAVPGYVKNGYSEWYPRNMYQKGDVRDYHIETFGEDVGYANFVDQFKAEKWDPKEWAELFKKSGRT